MSLHRSIIKILLNAPTSLADLQIATQVSLPTLRRAVQELTDSQWIRIVGQAEANGGRPAMLFGMDDRLFVIIGVHLQLPGIRIIMSDLTGKILDEYQIFNGMVPAPGEAVGAITEYVLRVRNKFPNRLFLGIGIATPGFIDSNSGDILTIGRVPSWGNFPFCRHLQAGVGLPIHIANDVDCMAFAEFEHSHELMEKSLAYVGFDEGVKASLFLNGKIYKGSLGNTGLISSHLLFVCDQPDLEEARSLITIIGVHRVFERRVRSLDSADQISYERILAVTNPRERFQLIIGHTYGKLTVCDTILKDLICMLSVAVANLIFMLQPDIVVIGGLLSLMPNRLFADLEIAVRAHLPPLISNNSIIQQGKLTSLNSASIGATYHFIQNYLNDTFTDIL